MRRNGLLAILLAANCCVLDSQVSTALCAPSSGSVWIDKLDVEKAIAAWQLPQCNRSADGNTLSIAGRKFKRGLGMAAPGSFYIALDGGATTFSALVGVDDDVYSYNRAEVEFRVLGDGALLWRSGPMRADEAARSAEVGLAGVRELALVVADLGRNDPLNHADWAMAKIKTNGAPPRTIAPYILTPPAPRAPRINGPRVFGVRTRAPLLFTIPTTGERPMRFAARDLPSGVCLDTERGRLTGAIETAGEYSVTLMAENALGRTERPLRLVVGDRICLTPPMGWNSWNCWGADVDAEKARSAARALVATGLIEHGWTYVNIDDGWQGERGSASGALQGNGKFPDMPALCDYIHNQGLKAGVYSTPWAVSYALYPGGSSDRPDGALGLDFGGLNLLDALRRARKEDIDALGGARAFGAHSFARLDAREWAEWGVDYVKYDWQPVDIAHAHEMRQALDATGRDIVLSLSNNVDFEQASDWRRVAQCWRTTGDIQDRWSRVAEIGFEQSRWSPFAAPGGWNDPDMLVVGKLRCWDKELHLTPLTPDEQYAHISLWCLLAAPLILGCDLAAIDDFTLSLLTNDEVLEVNQDPLGRQASRVAQQGDGEVWAKEMADGSRAVGLFNRSDAPTAAEVAVDWKALGLSGPQRVRDLWRQKDLGVFDNGFASRVAPHGVSLVRVFAASGQ